MPYDKEIIQRYRKALDTSVKIATVHNVSPIKGITIILCNLGNNMNRPCTAARGLGKPRQISEIAVLMGLMCKYSCEESQFIVYGDSDHRSVELEKGTILNNMDSVLRMQSVSLVYLKLDRYMTNKKSYNAIMAFNNIFSSC